MTIDTPEGKKECAVADYQLECPEPSFTIMIGNGDRIICRPIVGTVLVYTNSEGLPEYVVQNQLSICRVRG